MWITSRVVGFKPKTWINPMSMSRWLSTSNTATTSNATKIPIVKVDDDGRGVRRLILNNPRKRNALSLAMIQELNQHLANSMEQFEQHQQQQSPSSSTGQLLRALIISSNCDQIFSSGHDLKEMATNVDRRYRRKIFDEFTKLMLQIRDLPVPVICQVDGLAAAAGCQLVASCDIVLATEQSQFSTPGANVGLFCSTPGVALARSANIRTAAYMLMTGRPINAQQAWISGLITQVYPSSEQMHLQTEIILDSILTKSASVIRLGKQFFYQQIKLDDLSKAYCQAAEVMVNNLSLNDGQEGLEAFLQKRPAKWTHSNESN